MPASARLNLGADGHPDPQDPKIERVSMRAPQRSSVVGRRTDRGTSVAVDNPMMQYTLQLMAHRINCGLGAIPTKQRSEGSVANRHGPSIANVQEYKGPAAGGVPEDAVVNDPEPEALDKETEFFLGASNADPSLIMSMERTLFSAYDQAIMLTISGMGFMSVGDNNPGGTTSFGAFLLVCAVCYTLLSYFMHCWRLWRLGRGMGLAPYDSQIWTGTLTALIFICLLMEIYWGFKFPFLERAKAVEIANTDALPGLSSPPPAP